MRVLICGEKDECETLKKLLISLPFIISHIVTADDYEEIHNLIVDAQPEVAIVCDNGAKGMESVYRIKDSGNVPVIWFSDDKNFAVHSYRLGCSYFGVKPIEVESLKKAISALKI